MTICDCVKEAVWISGMVYHECTKHIAVKFHFIREMLTANVVKLFKIDTAENQADKGTTVVTVSKFQLCLDLLHIC